MPFLQPLNCEKVKFHAFFGKGEQRGARPSAKADGRTRAAAIAAACRIRRSRIRRAACVEHYVWVAAFDVVCEETGKLKAA